ncbi:MAG: peptidylprolyl isomerase [Phycisphaerae bacterium]|nr:peptidylprolyl isomerase [Phycisphaerae bacterium]
MYKASVKRKPRHLLPAAVCFLVAAGFGPTVAQDTPGGPEESVEPLRAELRAVTPLYPLEGPLRLRFTLVNTSDEPVNIPLGEPIRGADGIVLPLEVALGTPEAPVLSVSFDDEDRVAVQPLTSPGEPAKGSRRLRIAPHGSVGADLDLRFYHQAARYPGAYRVEWRPLAGRLGTVSTQFKVEPRKDAILVTDYGRITFVLEYDQAPRNLANFLELVREGFYDKKTFHRIIPGFVIQGGCPKGDGTGLRPDGKLIPAEFHDAPVELGTLLMARKPSDPNSASCQFFIALARLEQLDGQFTVIGQAGDEESLRALQKLAGVETDRRDRPAPPVKINSINLVPIEEPRVRHLEIRGARASTPGTSKKPKTAEQKSKP